MGGTTVVVHDRKICNFTGNRDHINKKVKKQGWYVADA